MADIDVKGHVLYALRNATLNQWPFPHFYAENVFPRDFYENLLEKLAQKQDFREGAKAYSGRKFAKFQDFPELDFMDTKEFLKNVASIFQAQFSALAQHKTSIDLHADLRFVRDPKDYSIGPHTDAPWKLISLLFYLPPDYSYAECGTSIYLPKNRAFRCPGGPHHEFKDFDRIHTAPYLPNTCFGFFKTDNSFHGVEPLAEQFNRDVLLYNVYDYEQYSKLPTMEAS